eukprot:m.14548 g.14548  ORF g.14548 m.14548 type:complete len:497 (+) comp10195_c1_seq1:297-1787(+)
MASNLNNVVASGSPKPSRWGRRLLGKLRHKTKSLKLKGKGAEDYTLFTLPFDQAPLANDGCDVPVVLRILLDFVEAHVKDLPALYTADSDKHGKAEMLKQQLEDDVELWLKPDDGVDVAVVATLVKRWFQEQYGTFMFGAPTSDTDGNADTPPAPDTNVNALEQIKSGLETMHPKVACVLSHLTWHCAFVAKHGTDVTVLTLAEALSDSTGIPTEYLLLLIMKQDEVFESLKGKGKGGEREPCSYEVYRKATEDVRLKLTAAPPSTTINRRRSKLAIDDTASALEECASAQTMQADVRALEMDLARHRRDIKVASDKGKEYSSKSMDKMLATQRALTALKRTLKTRQMEEEEEDTEDNTPVGSVGMLLKQLREHAFEHEELVEIKKKLDSDLETERALVEKLRVQSTSNAAAAAATRSELPQLYFGEPATMEELLARLDTERQVYERLETTRKRHDEALVKERAECAAVHTQIKVLRPVGTHEKLTRDWNYRLPDL